jgi:uncharacterized protein Smg (DUF494 family)
MNRNMSRILDSRDNIRPKSEGSIAREGSEWWQAVRVVADWLASSEIDISDLDDINPLLKARGFSAKSIDKAMDWIGHAHVTSDLQEVLELLGDKNESVRIESFVERTYLAHGLWQTVQNCQRRGLISSDLSERMLDSAMNIDTRDWDIDEVESFIETVLFMASGPRGSTLPQFRSQVILGKPKSNSKKNTLYC